MKRPEDARLDRLLDTVDLLREAEAQVADLKAQLPAQAHALAQETDPNVRLAAATYAYWFAPEVGAADLAFAVTGRHHASFLLKLMGPIQSAIPCDRCGADLPVGSRQAMKDILSRRKRAYALPEGYRVLCGACWSDINAERETTGAERARAHEQRVGELQALPYVDYLRTSEWAKTRDQFLYFELKERAWDFECETCDATGELGLFHRTLEGLGGHDRLVMLCPTCLAALRSVGSIAGSPGPGNLITAATALRVRAAFEAERGG